MANAVGSGKAASTAMSTVIAPVVEVEGQGDAATQSAEVEAVAPVTGAKWKRVAEAEGSREDASAAVATVVAPIAEVERQRDEAAGSSPITAPTYLKEKFKSTSTTTGSALTLHLWIIHIPMDKLSGPMY
jgi:hypothetical protein